MDSVKQSGYILTGVGIVGFVILFITVGFDSLFVLVTDDIIFVSPILVMIISILCLVTGVGALTGVLPDRWFTE
jgi:hypothetical protein